MLIDGANRHDMQLKFAQRALRVDSDLRNRAPRLLARTYLWVLRRAADRTVIVAFPTVCRIAGGELLHWHDDILFCASAYKSGKRTASTTRSFIIRIAIDSGATQQTSK